MSVRRVVTGLAKDGRSRVLNDDIVEGVRLDAGVITPVWGFDVLPASPNDGRPPAFQGFFPLAGGTRFMTCVVLPDSLPRVRAADTDLVELGTDVGDALEQGENAGMHKSATIDYIVVVSGVVGIELDDGETLLMRQGDMMVQNGARHRWFNPGAEPATFVAMVVGASSNSAGG